MHETVIENGIARMRQIEVACRAGARQRILNVGANT